VQWRLGSYLFPAGCVSFRTQRQTLRNGAGVPYSERATITLAGVLFGDSQAAIAFQMAALEAAVRVPYQDLVLVRDDGGPGAGLLNATSTTGVVCTQGPSWDGDGANFSTFINFQGLTFEADYPLTTGQANVLVAFTESVRVTGGLAQIAWLRPSTGPVIRQRVTDATEYRVTQRGTAVGFLDYPAVPPPLWPDALEGQDITYDDPELQGAQFRNFKVSWAYEFGSADPLPGALPTRWPV
jgi:hypothetical protein